MRVTMAQINPIVGDVEGNVARVSRTLEQVSRENPDLVVFPELVITGYPPKDLLEREAFVERAGEGLDDVARISKRYPGVGIVVGCPVPTGLAEGKPLYNAAFLMADGEILFRQEKLLLPMYDVFDEARYFRAATDNRVFEFAGETLGLSICEDLWFEPDPWNRRPYACDPIEMLAKKGATFIINISASPFSVGKEKARYELIKNHTTEHGVPFLFVNEVGGNDDLVFDGRSLFVDAKGNARVVLPSFEEAVRTVDTKETGESTPYEYETEIDTVYKALVLGTRDYFGKCGFSKAVIGLSGGVDSAVTAVIASGALGKENVVVIAMPSPFSSPASLEDARALAKNLGVRLEVLGIEGAMKAYDDLLEPSFQGTAPNETEENIQARIRGNILMAFSNKFGYLPLSTGNKSELAVGYCTLYGDMSGGLAVISDVPKTMVYELARRINREKEIIPQDIIDKVPSAELRPNQTDQDTLPPYEVLDAILEYYIDRHWSIDRIVGEGYDRETVSWVINTVYKNEYKRKQAAPGIKVTSKAFGTGRRMPIASKYNV